MQMISKQITHRIFAVEDIWHVNRAAPCYFRMGPGEMKVLSETSVRSASWRVKDSILAC